MAEETSNVMQAVLLTGSGDATAHFTVGETIKPVPSGRQLLCRVVASGLNPVDWKMAAHGVLFDATDLPLVLGCDMAGTVVQVGDECTLGFKVNDEVLAYPGLGKPGRGTFAEYVLVDERLAMRRPGSLSPVDAATIPVGLYTAALGMYTAMKLPLPGTVSESDDKPVFLVWGGSSTVGSFAVQLAKLSGFEVVATASPSNFEAVKRAGATHVVNYRDEDAVEQIRKLKPVAAFDAISGAATKFTAEALVGQDGAQLASVGQEDPAVVGVAFHPVFLGGIPDNDELTGEFVKVVPELARLVETGALLPWNVALYSGLDGVLQGLKDLHESRLSGKKAVASLVG